MLEEKDLKAIGALIHTEVIASEERLEERLTGKFRHELHMEITASEERMTGKFHSGLNNAITASEERMTGKLHNELNSAIRASEERVTSKIRGEIADLLDTAVFPQFVEIHARFDQVDQQFVKVNQRIEDLNFSMRDGWRRVDRKFDDLIEVLCQEKAIPNSAAALLERTRIAR